MIRLLIYNLVFIRRSIGWLGRYHTIRLEDYKTFEGIKYNEHGAASCGQLYKVIF